jgi:hypothetical protein
MNTSVIDSATSRAIAARLTEDALVVDLADGRTVSAPLAWYPRLMQGTRLNAPTTGLSVKVKEFTGLTWMRYQRGKHSGREQIRRRLEII